MRPAVLLASALVLHGCYFARSPIRPIPALHLRGAERSACLVILVPGLMDGPDSFVEHGLAREVVTRTGCEAVAVDLTYRYYFGAEAGAVLWEDVLAPAVARGYREIWLVGTSMGSLGAVLLAREHPELVDGIVMLSPFLGLEEEVAAIERAGGLAAWRPPGDLPETISDATFTTFVWSWLRGYVDDPDAMPELFVGWAEGERLDPTSRVLAGALPEGRAISQRGTHGWATWGPLFARILERARIGRRAP